MTRLSTWIWDMAKQVVMDVKSNAGLLSDTP